MSGRWKPDFVHVRSLAYMGPYELVKPLPYTVGPFTIRERARWIHRDGPVVEIIVS